MKIPKPSVNYLELRPGNLLSEKFRHLLLLLYWPFYCVVFMFLEHTYPKYMSSLGKEFHVMHCALDDIIPFNEIFLVPYMFWFLYIIFVLLYTLLYDVDAYNGMMTFVIITYTLSLIIYFTYPTIQHLRPTIFERDNFLTDYMRAFYNFDTNTNICPSVHVFGSFASTFTIMHIKNAGLKLKIAANIMNILICLSTVFLKQHSAIDVFVALPICLIAYFISFRFEGKKDKKAKEYVI